MNDKIQTDPDLLRQLQAAAGRPMTSEEIRRQRVSFILGNMPTESNVTKHQIEEILARGEGDKAVA